ncbi:hypothetical protein GL325_08615 [Aeromicrobium sp. 636]|uniref:Uncharacterized protein n=1 Tax=Aeromicrobium senzhongii TaxID=2663859 RepID=A0A8I0ETY2_9ACTN|nr:MULTISPECIES: hypothetical protein [Aeromicrobium]MBC9226381.1 hypothetical protein [Aeromicrobium senzhongii]MCQ3998486.1 hypothetical protein [Aeromicrobium sp. 636]
MTIRRLLYLVVAVVAVLAVVWLVLFLTRGETSSATGTDAYPDRAEGVAFVDEAVVHDDLGRRAATSQFNQTNIRVLRGSAPRMPGGVAHAPR